MEGLMGGKLLTGGGQDDKNRGRWVELNGVGMEGGRERKYYHGRRKEEVRWEGEGGKNDHGGRGERRKYNTVYKQEDKRITRKYEVRNIQAATHLLVLTKQFDYTHIR